MSRAWILRSILVSSLAGGTVIPAAAQQWEVGALGGGSFYLNNSVTGAVTGKAGLQSGWTAGVFMGKSAPGRLGGEFRYLMQRTNLSVSSASQSATFGAQTHTVHYDFLVHGGTHEDSVRPFVAFGGGLKNYRGTGAERAFQPAADAAILSRTQQWQPVVSFGAGVKWQVGSRMMMRVEVRDYTSPFPKDVILPAPGNKIGGWIHDIIPMFGVSYLF